MICRSGGTGRRPGLKIPWVVIPVPVRFRSAALVKNGRNVESVKERIEGGANEKAVLRFFTNCPFVCINFDFFWLNKARQLYMDF